jgi:predicted NBD/HSP70 family sugar kinase
LTGSTFYSVEKLIEGRSGGTTQAETRLYNHRLILSLIRRKGQLSKVELTRLTGLSPQTITTLVNRAADEGLLRRLEPLRGRLGQPSVPYTLEPSGAFSLGLHVGRRGASLALLNFIGDVVAFQAIEYDYPTPEHIIAFAKASIGKLLKKHRSAEDRVAGLGIASPFRLWDWAEEVEAPPDKLAEWRDVDIRTRLDDAFQWPVYLLNDATVSAAGELMFGAGSSRGEFLYAYIDYFVGGGLVLDHHLFPGRNKLAADLGSLLVPSRANGQAQFAPLLDTASLHALSTRLGKKGHLIFGAIDDWTSLGRGVDEWLSESAHALAYAVHQAVVIVDVDSVIIDGAFPPAVRRELVREVRRKLAKVLADRPEPFAVLEGTLGRRGPAVGGASVPFLVNFSNDKEVLFKDKPSVNL